MVHITMVLQHYLKNDLKYKHSGATGKLLGVVSRADITVYYVRFQLVCSADLKKDLLIKIRTDIPCGTIVVPMVL
jgi:hypothetical protein